MIKVVWRAPALDELDAIIDFIEQFDPDAAARIGRRLFELGESLVRFPHRGRPKSDGRRELTTVPPYILTYEVVGDEVSILGIRHGARAPDRP